MPSRAILPAIIALAAQVAIGCAPASASADGFERGLPCRYTGSGGISPPKVYFTTVPGRAYTPPVGRFTDSEHQPAGNFSATVNWGDGTTSPGAVKVEESCSGVYEASAPSHTYSTPGTYSFSYTIHDASTGLDHSVGVETFYVPTALPTPILGSTLPVVQAKIGTTWSGVVGEFQMNIGNGIPTSAYSASIEWGDGQTSPGVIANAPIFPRFTVSGSHTYARALSAAIKVSVSGVIETGNWATTNVVATPPPPMFVGQPILAAIPSVKKSTEHLIVLRLDRPLPKTKSGRILASLSGFGATGSLASFGLHRSRHCYAAGVTISRGRRSAAHHSYPFTLSIQGPPVATIHAHATQRRYFNYVSMLHDAVKRLAC